MLPSFTKTSRSESNDDSVRVNVTVQRITEPESINELLRISFQLVPHVDSPIREESPSKSTKRHTSREKEIARALQEAHEALQRSIEERDASNEEMKSTNEELQSTNEELQSTNEELETSKEELQSLNEELQTVNAEFQEKIQDLSQANDDMANLLNSSDIATVFLDNQLCIKRFTEQAKNVIRLISTDVGRPLRDLTSSLQHEDLVSDAKEVLKTLVFKECEVCTDDGNWLLMRIVPYRTSEDKIDGLVVTFVDINQLRSVQRESQLARAYAESIVGTMRESLLILDSDLRVRTANDSFYRKFQVTPEAAIPGPWDRLDANGTKRQSGGTYRKRGRITFSSVL
ncbi:MAG: two-component system CheB/CheR fusion protein [Planctomycetaceae bacterium]|jgi:two-component system CheB/CheR fusion protein